MSSIQLIPVDSTQISAIGYDAATQTLPVQFAKGKAHYEYDEVPAEVHAAFMASESKGKFFQGTIKPQYEHRLIPIPANDGEANGEAQAA